MNTNNNPLLDFTGLPRFDVIRAADVTPAVDALLAEGHRAIETVATATAAPTWDTVVEPLAESLDRLDRAWGAVRHLNAVVNTPELREAHNAHQPKVIAFYTALAQDLRL
ncbi:MAG: oligopeptidase A, partial [Casimicrobiaceae bacterium]